MLLILIFIFQSLEYKQKMKVHTLLKEYTPPEVKLSITYFIF